MISQFPATIARARLSDIAITTHLTPFDFFMYETVQRQPPTQRDVNRGSL